MQVTLENEIACVLSARCVTCESLDPHAAGVAQAVLQLDAGCNRPGGFVITFRPDHAGALVHEDDPDLAVPYRIRLTLPARPGDLIAIAAPETLALKPAPALPGPAPGALQLVMEHPAVADGRPGQHRPHPLQSANEIQGATMRSRPNIRKPRHAAARLLLGPVVLPLLGALLLQPSGPAQAVSLSPMMITLPVAGRDQVRLENDGARTITVELKAFRRIIDEVGEQTLEPADADFIVFPPFAAVAAGRAQLFQVQYLGDVSITSSRSYYLNVKQLPVDVDPVRVEGGGELTFLFAFNVAVNIVPNGALPSLRVESARQADDGLEVLFANDGNRFVYLRDAVVTLSAGGRSVPLDRRGQEVLADQNVLEPGQRRWVVLPLPTGIASDGVQVDVSLRENYR